MEARDAGGGLEDLVMLGFNSGNGQTFYHGRGGAGWTWYDIEDGSANPVFTRTTDWRNLKAVIKSTTIEFYVDDVLGVTASKNPGYTYDTITIGTGYSSQEQVWFDDLQVYNIPEPASIFLLGLGGLFLRRRRG